MGRVKRVDCASALLDYWVAAYGPLDRILSDGGPQFTVRFWTQVCNMLSVEPKNTTPGNLYKRNNDAELRPTTAVIREGGFVFKRDHDYKGPKLGHRARRPYRVVSMEGPTVVIDVDGEHRRENEAPLIPTGAGPAVDTDVHPALRDARPRQPRA